jgi:hypothetical protein
MNIRWIDIEKRNMTCHFICENTVETIVMQRDHPIESLKLISTHFTFDDWRMVVRMDMYFEKKRAHSSEMIQKQRVGRCHRLQPLRPSKVPRLPLSQIFDGEHCYRYNVQKVSDIHN